MPMIQATPKRESSGLSNVIVELQPEVQVAG